MQALWTTIFYQPIYNALIFLINSVTFGDVGFAVIILTIVVKLILFPISKKSVKSQLLLKKLEPLLKQIKKDFPKKEDQAKKTFEIYKQYGVNPFSGCLMIIIQLPIIFALYYVFYKGLTLGTGPLYSFVSAPEHMNTFFLGIFDTSGKSIVLAVLAGISQFIHGYLSMPLKPKEKVVSTEPRTFQEQLSESMTTNVRYILPIFVAIIAYQISAAVAIYWITSNVVTIIQEWYIRRSLKDTVIAQNA